MKKFKNILLVDDDAICSWLNKALLEEMQIVQNIICLNDGQSAIDYLKRACSVPADEKTVLPDLILLDLNMPGVDGFEVLEKLKNSKGCEKLIAERVIVLTTSMHEKDVERAKSYNIFGYLAKPLTETKLQSVLEGVSISSDEGVSKKQTGSIHTHLLDRESVERNSGLSAPSKDIKKQPGA